MYNHIDDERDVNYTEGSWTDSNSYSDPSRRVDYSRPTNPSPGKGFHRSVGKRIAILVASGLLFGAVAGTTMGTVNMALSNLSKNTEEVKETEAMLPESRMLTEEEIASAAPYVSTGNDVSAIVEKAMPSLVSINNKTLYTQNDWFFGKQQYEVPSSGSGIIANKSDTELLIITNNHVIDNATEISVVFVDGTSVNAAVKGTDADADLAVIAVQLKDVPEETLDKITLAEIGNSDDLKLGQGVIAIGNALGHGQSVTVGYVSMINKEVQIGDVSRKVLQVDAAINPGNSGGALLNMKGELIGINEAKYSSTSVEGVGYAIPISYAKDIIDDLMTKNTRIAVAEEEQGYLGIQLQNIDARMSQAYGMPQGIYVYKVVEGSGAAASELKECDIITKIDGQKLNNGEELQKMLTYYKKGTTVTVTVQRLENGAYVEKEVAITLGGRIEEPM